MWKGERLSEYARVGDATDEMSLMMMSIITAVFIQEAAPRRVGRLPLYLMAARRVVFFRAILIMGRHQIGQSTIASVWFP